MRFVLVLLTVALCAVLSASQQSAPSATPSRADAAISGVVIDGVTKQPIADAVVELGWPQRREFPDFSHRQFTDARGRFVFAGLPAGTGYAVRATRTGFFTNAHGAVGVENQSGPAIELADGEWFQSAGITLWPPASISGTVTDESGEPAIGVFVRLVASFRLGAGEHWAVGRLMVTDDRGMYRAGDLQPGRYFVMVPSVQSSLPDGIAPGNSFLEQGRLVAVDGGTRLAVSGYPVPPPPIDGRRFTYSMTFAGSRTLSDARPVEVRAGDDLGNIDIRLEPVRAVTVAGRVQGTPDHVSGVFLRLVPEGLEDLGHGGEAATTITSSGGSFVFANVPAGRYMIESRSAVRQYLIGSMGIFYVPRLPSPPGAVGLGNNGSYLASLPGFGIADGAGRGVANWARTPVSVGSTDLVGVAVPLHPMSSIRGRIETEVTPGIPAPSTPPRYLQLQSSSGASWQGRPSSSLDRSVPAGQFLIDSIVPGTYVLQAEETGWMIKSVAVNGRDRTNATIEIPDGENITDFLVTFTNAIPSIAGQVALDSGAKSGGAAVIMFPADRDEWTNRGAQPLRMKTAQASTAGAFQIRGLPAGEYLAVAVPAERMHDWRQQEFLARVAPMATRVTVRWGERTSITLRIIDVR